MKPVFKTPEEAIQALRQDRLGTVYYRADGIFVATAFGTGMFTRKQWDDANGFRPSVEG